MKNEIFVDLAIIGAGTAGLSAFSEASKVSKKIVLIDHGPLGTTCARVGCMPSKVLLHIAEQFHERHFFKSLGINGSDKLTIDIVSAMQHVRKLRDYFTSGVIETIKALGDQFISGTAELLEPTVIKVNQKKIIAKKIIIATGVSQIIPSEWQSFSSNILTNENFFEQESFSKKIAVIGGGAEGLELAQALSRLMIDVALFHSHETIGKLSDPIINQTAIDVLKKEFPLFLGSRAVVEKNKNELLVKNRNQQFSAEQILVSLGKQSNLKEFNLEKLGIKVNERGIPDYDKQTMQINNSAIFIAGDVDQDKKLLHEAADEGRIAGFNAMRDKPECFIRRTPLMMIFTQPNIIVVGQSYRDMPDHFITGEVDFRKQGRALIMNKNNGKLHVYANPDDGKLLGAEMIAPAGEHLGHLLACAIQKNMTVFDLLQLPFYHPTIEEGLRTALRDLAKQVKTRHMSLELMRLLDT